MQANNVVQVEKDSYLSLWNSILNPKGDSGFVNSPEKNDPLAQAAFVKELHQEHVSLTDITHLNSIDTISVEDKEFITSIYKFLSSPDIGITMLRQVIADGFLSIETDASKSKYKCDSSITKGLPNFLIYQNNSETIIVVQHLFSTIGVFFPRQLLSISWAPWDVSFPHWVNWIIEHFVKEYSVVNDYLKKDNKKLSGVRMGIFRPYHQIYDQLVAFYSVMAEYNNSVCDFPIWIMGNHAFLSSKALYGPDFNEIIIKDTEEINSKNFSDDTFTLLFGVVNSSVIGREKSVKCFDALKIHAEETMSREPDFVSRLAALKSCAPIVWLGVNAQKRIWVEQEEGLKQIIIKLYERFPSLGVIFDGWTAPIFPSESDLNEIAADAEVMSRIIQDIPKEIHVESVIGATSTEKIAFGNNVDFYITNLLTGSLHIDNICKKSGIGHMNRIWQGYVNSGTIYHNNCLRIDDEFITHRSEGRPDEISYSIPWEKVYERLCGLIDTLPAFTNPISPINIQNQEQQ